MSVLRSDNARVSGQRNTHLHQCWQCSRPGWQRYLRGNAPCYRYTRCLRDLSHCRSLPQRHHSASRRLYLPCLRELLVDMVVESAEQLTGASHVRYCGVVIVGDVDGITAGGVA